VEKTPSKVSYFPMRWEVGGPFEDPFFSESVSGIARTMDMVSNVRKSISSYAIIALIAMFRVETRGG